MKSVDVKGTLHERLLFLLQKNGREMSSVNRLPRGHWSSPEKGGMKSADEKCGCDVNAVNRITGGHWSSPGKNRWRVQTSDELCCQYTARQVTDPCFGKLCYQVNSKAGDWSSSEINGWRVKMWMNPVNTNLQGRDRSSGKNGVKSADAGWTLRPLIFFGRMDEECRWGMNFGNKYAASSLQMFFWKGWMKNTDEGWTLLTVHREKATDIHLESRMDEECGCRMNSEAADLHLWKGWMNRRTKDEFWGERMFFRKKVWMKSANEGWTLRRLDALLDVLLEESMNEECE